MKKPRTVIADEHPIVRVGIKTALADRVEIVGETGDGRDAVDLAKSKQAELVILSVSLPRMTGLEATTVILKEQPKVRVVVFTRHANMDYLASAMRCGAHAYVLKSGGVSELTAAVNTVMGGEFYVSQPFGARFAKTGFRMITHKGQLESMTARQREVWQLIAEGQTTKAIAIILKISAKTVEYHRANIMSKLGIFDIPGLVRKAYEVGLLSL